MILGFALFTYYPFGMVSRSTYLGNQNLGYRYTFNGKENDGDVKGDGNQIDYGARVYDPRLGRFLSIDPLTKSYPWYTPYQFAGNKPIEAIDLDGLEEFRVNDGKQTVNGPYANQQAAQNAVDRGMAIPQLPAPRVQKALKNRSFLGELVNDAYTLFKIVTFDPGQPIAAQPNATSTVGQSIDMVLPFLPYEAIGEKIAVKIVARYMAGTFKIGAKTLAKVTAHLEQFGIQAENEVMLSRMGKIAKGEMKATEVDINFAKHELRESELMKDGKMTYDEAHHATLKEQGMGKMRVDEYEKKLYTQEALDAGNTQWEKEIKQK